MQSLAEDDFINPITKHTNKQPTKSEETDGTLKEDGGGDGSLTSSKRQGKEGAPETR